MRILKNFQVLNFFMLFGYCGFVKFLSFFKTNLRIIENTQLQSLKYYFYFYSHFPHTQVDKTYFNTSND